jgi:Na+/alanine symporter
MEETILPTQPSFKVYKDQAIYVGTFLGGPLVAGYLAAENFKQFREPDKVKTAWAIAILATLVIFGGIFLIPNVDKIPNYIIPIVYTGITQFLIKKYQATAIKSHIDAGGQAFSTWRAVWIGLVGLIFLLAVILGILLVTDKELFQ